MQDTQNHIAEIIQVASGDMLKKDYARIIGVDPTRLSRELPSHYERAIKKLQAQLTELQASATRLQADATQLQAQNEELQGQNNRYQEAATEIQGLESKFQGIINKLQDKNDRLQADNYLLQSEHDKLQAGWQHWRGQPDIIKWLARQSTLVYMLLLLAFFEIGGSFNLLRHKGLCVAVPVSVALGFALLVFTARGNLFGKLFCVSFALLVGALFFGLLPHGASDWLFAFTPPAIAAMVAFSFKNPKT